MANTSVAAANNVQQWSKEFYTEWMRDNELEPYMGTSDDAPIQVINELKTVPGDQITVSMVSRLTNAGVTGDSTLFGSEVAQGNFGHKITIDQLRNAVSVGKMEQKKTHIPLLNAAKKTLKNWRMDKAREEVLVALGSPNADGSTAYASCSEAQKDTWVTAQYTGDRVLFGAAVGNYSAADHSASLLNVDSTNDILQPAIVSLAKRVARRVATTKPNMRPIRVDGGGEWFLLLVPSVAFRDMKMHATTVAAHQGAGVRGENNPLFRDGDIVWDGVIIHEVPEISTIAGVGAAGIAVAPCYMLGAQAVGFAIGEETHAIFDEYDYGNIKGRGVSEMRGVDKLMFNGVQNGVLTLYVSGVADT